MSGSEEPKWLLYIPNDGHWPIRYEGNIEAEARAHARKMLKLRNLPKGSTVSKNPNYVEPFMSLRLKQYLQAWLWWAYTGAKTRNKYRFTRTHGLCDNAHYFSKNWHSLRMELIDLFEDEGLDDTYPFVEQSFDNRAENATQHLDPVRVAWVIKKLEKMNEPEFIASDSRAEWIADCGLSYYVRKDLRYEGLIQLANCHSESDGFACMWKFLRRYSQTVPFMMEQVLNYSLADYVRRCGWSEWRVEGVPQFYSPLAVERYSLVVVCTGEDITRDLFDRSDLNARRK